MKNTNNKTGRPFKRTKINHVAEIYDIQQEEYEVSNNIKKMFKEMDIAKKIKELESYIEMLPWAEEVFRDEIAVLQSE